MNCVLLQNQIDYLITFNFARLFLPAPINEKQIKTISTRFVFRRSTDGSFNSTAKLDRFSDDVYFQVSKKHSSLVACNLGPVGFHVLISRPFNSMIEGLVHWVVVVDVNGVVLQVIIKNPASFCLFRSFQKQIKLKYHK